MVKIKYKGTGREKKREGERETDSWMTLKFLIQSIWVSEMLFTGMGNTGGKTDYLRKTRSLVCMC